MVRYTELSPTGSETSGTDRQSEIVAAINGPICCGLEAKKFNHFSRAGRRACVQGKGAGPTPIAAPNRCVEVGSCKGLAIGERRTGYQSYSNVVCYTELHRPVQKLRALIGNPRSSQQLMGQLPICCCLKAKKFNDFSRAACAYVCQGKARLGSTPSDSSVWC